MKLEQNRRSGGCTLVPQCDDDHEFLQSLELVFDEGGMVTAEPNESLNGCIEVDPATVEDE